MNKCILLAFFLIIGISSCGRDDDTESLGCACTRMYCPPININDTSYANAVLSFICEASYFENSDSSFVNVYALNKSTSSIDSISKKFVLTSDSMYLLVLHEIEFDPGINWLESEMDFRKISIVISNSDQNISDTIENIRYKSIMDLGKCNTCLPPCGDEIVNRIYIKSPELEYLGVVQDSFRVFLK